MTSLRVGDILSYSAASQTQDPFGFRVVVPGRDYFGALRKHWPDLMTFVGNNGPLIINAYPAFLGHFSFGINLDTYLNLKTALRALTLARLQNRNAFLIGQPLFLAEILFAARAQSTQLPEKLLLLTGGYEMPLSLENTLRELMTNQGVTGQIIHCYGMAELDAACLFAFERNDAGELLYFVRDEQILVTNPGGDLSLSHTQHMGDSFSTGDQAHPYENYWVITPSHQRMEPRIRGLLSEWTSEEWLRRTGFLAFDGEQLIMQVRESGRTHTPNEQSFFTFAQNFGFSWLNKPSWGKITISDSLLQKC